MKRQFLDADFDTFVMKVDILDRNQISITLANGNNTTTIDLWADEVDELIKALKKARKAL